MSVGAAIVSRWNDSGLDSSVANLYRGTPEPADPFSSYSRTTFKNGGTPLDDDSPTFPRAEYLLAPEDRVIGTTAGTILNTTVVFKIWHNDLDTLEALQDTVVGLLDNSDRAATSPLSLSSGSTISMMFLGKEAWPVEDNVCTGVIRFSLEYIRTNTVPG